MDRLEFEEELYFSEKQIMNNLMSFSEREELGRTKTFKDFIYIWNSKVYNSALKVGKLMDSIRNLPVDSSREDWVQYYTENVRNWNDIHSNVSEIVSNEYLDYKTSLNYWWIHVMDRSFNGWVSEKAIIKMLEAHCEGKELFVRTSTDYEDRKLGVDVVIYNGVGKVKFGIQIKVESYFFSNRPTVVDAKERLNPYKYDLFRDRYPGSEVFYVIIEPSLQNNKLNWLKAKTLKS